MCPCASTIPGMMVLPVRSTCVAFFGADLSNPTRVIVSPSTSSAPFSMTRPSPVMIRACSNRVADVRLWAASNTKAAPTIQRVIATFLSLALMDAADVRQKARQQANQRQICADAVDELDARRVGQPSEDSGTQPTHAEREPEEQTRDQSNAAGHQLLCVDDDRRE